MASEKRLEQGLLSARVSAARADAVGEFRPPVLGLENPPTRVTWKDGTVMGQGILGSVFDPELQLAHEAEQARKRELRQHANVVVLDDFRKIEP
jgi:hypothetical protein